MPRLQPAHGVHSGAWPAKICIRDRLVDVLLADGQWSFGCDRLRRWVNMARSHGITEIEVAHLFTQWGAEFAPKIMVHTSSGLEKRFGWHTPAVGGEYTRFLRAFLPALKQELDDLVGLAHVWFPISDEPNDKEKATYAAAKATVADLQMCIRDSSKAWAPSSASSTRSTCNFSQGT